MNNNQKTEMRRDKIGFIFQNNQLLEDFNVVENISLPLILKGMKQKEAEKNLYNF